MGKSGFKFDPEEFETALMQALRKTYAVNQSYASEAAFKYELFHQLHGLKVGGRKLGTKLPSASTCMLHAEAKPINGLRGQRKFADIVICDPSKQNQYNWRTEVAVELKTSLSAGELRKELNKFAAYNGKVPRLYVISANTPGIRSEAATDVASAYRQSGTAIRVFSRQDFPAMRRNSTRHTSNDQIKGSLAEQVVECINFTLNLYGEDLKDPYHSFFWRNYEDENQKGWTFPCEGDFVAQLYHRLCSRLGQCVIAEYQPPSEPPSRVDLYVDDGIESVGIEIKMNYDNFKGKGEDEETAKISRKFKAMSRESANHKNILVVIQGQDAHKGTNKETTLANLRRYGAKFGLMYFDERKNKAIGPEDF